MLFYCFMPALKSPGLLLQRLPYSESSFILKAFTRESGLVTFIAKGAKRPKSRFRGVLDFYNLLQFVYPEKPRSEMAVLMEANFQEEFSRLKGDLARQAAANVLLEICLRYLHGQERSLPLYGLIVGSLRALDGHPADDVAGLRRLCIFVLEFCRVSGYSPQFVACVQCARAVDGHRLSMDPELGGPVCRRCLAGDRRSLPILRPGVSRWLGALQGESVAEGTVEAGEAQQALGFLLAYLGRHSGGEKRIRSLDFFYQVALEPAAR